MSATHGWWCNAVTFPTKCRNCGEGVFYFHCNCGSAVFFDALGEPWPIHDCETSWTRNLTRWTDGSGTINVELTPGVTVRRPPSGTIDAAVVTRARQGQQRQDPITAIKPDVNASATIVGVLRERTMKVDVAAALKLPGATTMASAFLGPLGKGCWGKITVHAPSPKEGVLRSYTAWVPADVLSEVGSAKGVTIAVGLRSQSVAGVGCLWVCSSYEVIG